MPKYKNKNNGTDLHDNKQTKKGKKNATLTSSAEVQRQTGSYFTLRREATLAEVGRVIHTIKEKQLRVNVEERVTNELKRVKGGLHQNSWW